MPQAGKYFVSSITNLQKAEKLPRHFATYNVDVAVINRKQNYWRDRAVKTWEISHINIRDYDNIKITPE